MSLSRQRCSKCNRNYSSGRNDWCNQCFQEQKDRQAHQVFPYNNMGIPAQHVPRNILPFFQRPVVPHAPAPAHAHVHVHIHVHEPVRESKGNAHASNMCITRNCPFHASLGGRCSQCSAKARKCSRGNCSGNASPNVNNGRCEGCTRDYGLKG